MIEDLKAYPEYVVSNLPWLEKVPRHWRLERAKGLFEKLDRPVRLEDETVTCFRDGTVTLRKNRRLRGYTEAIYELGYQGIRKGDLVIHAMDAFAGAVGVSDSDGKGSPIYGVCRPRLNAVSHYYAHVVREMARTQWILALSRGIRERSTDFRYESFGRQFVPVPPPDEQAAIVRFLDHANGKIERAIRAKRKLIALLNEQKSAIIHRAVTRGLDPNVKLKDCGVPWFREIPAHYRRTKLSRLCVSVRDGTHNPPPAVPGIHRLLSVRNVVHGRFVTRPDDRTMTPAAYRELQRSYTVEQGDVVIALVGATTGKSALVDDMQNVTVQRSLGILRPNTAITSGRFLNLLLGSQPIQGQIKQIMGKYAAQPGIYLNELSGLQVICPPKGDQVQIIDYVESKSRPLLAAIERTEREIVLLREYRTRLTADVVTGKLDVQEAVKKLPAEAEELPPDDEMPGNEIDDDVPVEVEA